jgi:ABC-type branched-subunit amino acid transport system ATPase component
MNEAVMNEAGSGAPVLRARGLRKHYGKGAGLVRAVDGVDLDVEAGETVAVMGPSGCGSPRCCTCSAGSTGPRPGRSGWPGGGSTSWARGPWPGCAARSWGSSSRPST